MPGEGAIPGAVFARIDSVENRLRDEIAEHREEHARRSDHASERLNDVEKRLAGIEGGVKVGAWFLGGIGAAVLAVGVGVLHLVLR